MGDDNATTNYDKHDDIDNDYNDDGDANDEG